MAAVAPGTGSGKAAIQRFSETYRAKRLQLARVAEPRQRRSGCSGEH